MIVRLFVTALLLTVSSYVHAQSIQPLNVDSIGLTFTAIAEQLDQNATLDTSEGGEMSKAEFFKTFWQTRAIQNDSSGNNMFKSYYRAAYSDALVRTTQDCGSGFHGNWRCLGPDTLPVQAMGYVNCVWADPADTNYVLAGTWGGLFKSTNGGESWQCITDNAPIIGGVIFVEWIAVNPLNTNTIFLGTSSHIGSRGTNLTSPGWSYGGAAILKSFDGGVTWQQEVIPIDAYPYNDTVQAIQKIYFTPDSARLYAFSGRKLFTRYNIGSGNSWVDISPTDVEDHTIFYDLEFDRGNQNHFFIANRMIADGINSRTSIWEAASSIGNWTRITSGFSDTLRDINDNSFVVSPETNISAWEISIPVGDTLFAIAISKDLHNGCYPYRGLFKYNINSVSTHQWTRINNTLPYAINPNNFCFELIVSPVSHINYNGNRRNIYFGTDIGYHSFNGGISFVPMTSYGGNPVHGDVRGMFLQSYGDTLRGIKDRLYMANDGGVALRPSYSDDSILTENASININGRGLSCGHFWSVATSEERGILLGCAMHNGVDAYEPTQTTTWQHLTFEDAYTSMFDKANREIGYKIAGFPTIGRSSTQSGGGRILNNAAGAANYPDENEHEYAPEMLANEDNQHYTGLNTLWKQSSPNATWFPRGRDNWNLANGKIHDIAMNPYDSNFNGYVLSTDGKHLYKRISSSNFVNISSSVPGISVFSISCVETDPYNTNNVWVGYSGINFTELTPTHNRVVFSSDAGSTWVDISAGLPKRVPVSKFVYDESRKVLYSATDVGIYRYDFTEYNPDSTSNGYNSSVEWECFSKGISGSPDFPNVFVTDLDINYCENKLYASTYGRSIWVTDLYDNSSFVAANVTQNITSTTTWSSSKYLTGNIYISPGDTLKIRGANTVIHMPKNGTIKVDSAACLIVDSATITNNCSNCQWEGIQLGGRNSDNQAVDKQGKVWLTDATIEHAKIAISNKYAGTTSSNYSGGRILAERTRFINNSRSVKLWEYYKTAGKYAATFKQCTFEVNMNFKGDTTASFFSHIDLNHVDGPAFFGCQFLSRFTGQYRCLGYGIRAMDAGFKVKHHCTSVITNPCTTSVRSQFKGFLYGIYADRSIVGDYGMEVDRADFDSCSFGIRAINLSSVPVITRDTFRIGHGIDSYIGFDCHKNVGIFATAVPQFIIEGNYFKGYTDTGWQDPAHDNVGTLMEDCRDNDKLIYNCYFTELDRANLSWGTNTLTYRSANANTDPRIFTGLRYHCNTFVNDTTDICVEGVNFTGGIAAWQGSPTVSAGNTFGANSHNHLKVVNAPYPMYYSGSGSNQIPNQPSLYINNAFASSNNSCASSIDFPYPTQTKLDKKDGFYTGRTALNAMITTLSNAIDNGNTASLVSYIEGSTEPDAEDVKATLLGYSPYLSGTVLKAIANKNILTQGDLTEILQANPDMLRYPDLLDYLHTSIPNPYDNGEIEAFITASHDTTSRTTLEANIYKQRSEISLLASELIADMQLDSANTDIDSIPVWYGNMNTLAAEYGKVGHYTGIGNYTAAADALDDIPNNINLSDAEQAELENYVDFWTLIKNVKLDNRGFDELTGGELSDLETVLGNSNTNDWVNVGVGTVSSDPGDPMRIPCVRPEATAFNKRGVPEKNVNKNKPGIIANKKYVKAYPNPANEHVTFDYMIPGKNLNLSMSVVNIVGQKVKEMPLKASIGKVQWDTRSVPTGVYIFKVYDGAKIVETGRLVISR